jgi:hypothetical protein
VGGGAEGELVFGGQCRKVVGFGHGPRRGQALAGRSSGGSAACPPGWGHGGCNPIGRRACPSSCASRQSSATDVTPLLLSFIAGLGLGIVSVEQVGLDPAGAVQTLDVAGRITDRPPVVSGVRIGFQSAGGEKRYLICLQVIVDRDMARPGTATGDYLRPSQPTDGMRRSARAGLARPGDTGGTVPVHARRCRLPLRAPRGASARRNPAPARRAP